MARNLGIQLRNLVEANVSDAEIDEYIDNQVPKRFAKQCHQFMSNIRKSRDDLMSREPLSQLSRCDTVTTTVETMCDSTVSDVDEQDSNDSGINDYLMLLAERPASVRDGIYSMRDYKFVIDLLIKQGVTATVLRKFSNDDWIPVLDKHLSEGPAVCVSNNLVNKPDIKPNVDVVEDKSLGVVDGNIMESNKTPRSSSEKVVKKKKTGSSSTDLDHISSIYPFLSSCSDKRFLNMLENKDGFFYSKRVRSLRCAVEFKRLNESILNCISRSAYRATTVIVKGEIVKGSMEDFLNHRVFYDVRRKRTVLTSEFNRSVNTDCFITPDCKVCPEHEFVDLPSFHEPPIVPTFTQAGPGCGKTTRLIQIAKSVEPSNVLVLTQSKSNCDGLKERLPGVHVATLDSFLMTHVRRAQRNTPVKRTFPLLLFDECGLAHSGKLWYAIFLAKCEVCHGFADVLQIGFIDRRSPSDIDYFTVEYHNFTNSFLLAEQLRVSYRLPADVCFALNMHYKNPLQPLVSANTCKSSSVDYADIGDLSTSIGSISYDQTLTFTQEDKKQFSSAKTVHEYQSAEDNYVRVVYNGGPDSDILNSVPHAIVAFSRHKKFMKFFTSHIDGELVRLIQKAKTYSYGKRDYIGGYTDILESERVIGWIHAQPFSVAAAPRSSSDIIPDSWRDKRTVVLRSSNVENISASTGKHAVLTFPSYRKYTYSDLDSLFTSFSFVIRDRNVLIHASLFGDRIDSSLIVKKLNKHGADRVIIHTVGSEVVSSEVFNLATVNDVMDCPELVPIKTDQFEVDIPDNIVEKECIVSAVPIIQEFVNDLVGPTANFDNITYDEYLFNTSDFEIPDGIEYNDIKGHYKHSEYDCLRPLLHTSCPRVQQNTLINNCHSIVKRNFNVPNLTAVEDVTVQVKIMFDKLADICPGLNRSSLNIGPDSIQRWCNDQPESIYSKLEDVTGLHDYPMDRYSMALKSAPKPDMTPYANVEYPAVQTILCQDKQVNAIFCPIWRMIRDRIMTSLDPKVKFFTLCDDSEFADRLTHDFPPNIASTYYCVEYDMSKYDKSQGRLILEFEMELLRQFGVPQFFIELWFQAHVHTVNSNRSIGLKFTTWYQRKSGDASTYFGNTLCLLLSLLDIVTPEDIGMLLCSGDDSLLWCKTDPRTLDYSILSSRYNFQVKQFIFDYHYFCSKFLIAKDNRWFMVPDPLKRAIKLGRADLKNYEHVEEYRVSFCDNVRLYNDYDLGLIVEKAVNERYGFSSLTAVAMCAMYSLAFDKEEFHSLFFSLPGDNLCMELTRPKLEL